MMSWIKIVSKANKCYSFKQKFSITKYIVYKLWLLFAFNDRIDSAGLTAGFED